MKVGTLFRCFESPPSLCGATWEEEVTATAVNCVLHLWGTAVQQTKRNLFSTYIAHGCRPDIRCCSSSTSLVASPEADARPTTYIACYIIFGP